MGDQSAVYSLQEREEGRELSNGGSGSRSSHYRASEWGTRSADLRSRPDHLSTAARHSGGCSCSISLVFFAETCADSPRASLALLAWRCDGQVCQVAPHVARRDGSQPGVVRA